MIEIHLTESDIHLKVHRFKIFKSATWKNGESVWSFLNFPQFQRRPFDLSSCPGHNNWRDCHHTAPQALIAELRLISSLRTTTWSNTVIQISWGAMVTGQGLNGNIWEWSAWSATHQTLGNVCVCSRVCVCIVYMNIYVPYVYVYIYIWKYAIQSVNIFIMNMYAHNRLCKHTVKTSVNQQVLTYHTLCSHCSWLVTLLYVLSNP